MKSFIENGAQFISSLRLDNYENKSFNLFSNFNFIFCVRDTTIAQFTAHFISRALNFFHQDISAQVDQNLISKNKIKYLSNVLSDDKPLKKESYIISKITTEPRTTKYIFPLFNRDYKKIMMCLEKISLNKEMGRNYTELIKHHEARANFGAHGILVRLIFDLFNDHGYFSDIGTDYHEYSIPRVILTYLRNYQKEHVDKFLDNAQYSSLDLRKLYDDFYKIVDIDTFSDKLCGMYLLHKRKYWNHLVNFDVSYPVEVGNLNNVFKQYSTGRCFSDDDGRIRITCAGRIFAQRVCSHFEYFACRYFRDSKPLFSYSNRKKLDNDPNDEGYLCIKLINDVYQQVEKCCATVAEFDQHIADCYYGGDLSNYMSSHYVYNQCQSHIERILNYHISYIDAYRLYIIENGTDKDKSDICKRLFDAIKNYVSLMDYYISKGLISDHSKHDLFEKKYSVQIDKIEKSCNYLLPIPISWEEIPNETD